MAIITDKEFDVYYLFFKELDENSITTWSILPFEMEIKYYDNDPNLNLNEILYKLNEITRKVCL